MTRKAYKAEIGSISHGTLRTEDLLSAFVRELKRSRLPLAQRAAVNEANQWLAMAEDKRDDNIGDELVIELIDVLDSYAPECCYFGAHEGDGADFGFWPCTEAIDELPRIPDPDPALARKLGETCAYVNDHGNVTVFSAKGRVLWDCV